MIGAENFPKVEVLISGGNNNNGRSSFLFVRYSSSSDGSNMTESPNILTEYIGISVSDSPEAPSDKSKYQWVKVKGDKGDKGEDGTFVFEDAPKNGMYYGRKGGTWEKIPPIMFEYIGGHLDELKIPGFYSIYNSSVVTVANGFPYDEARGGHILALPVSIEPGKLTLFQVFLSAGTANSNYRDDARIYIRSFVNDDKWLPWREIDGGKIHNVTDRELIINTSYKGFPTDKATFIVNQPTTITLPNNVQRFRIVKNTEGSITFKAISGVDIIGDTVINDEIGTEITVVCNGTKAFISYPKAANKVMMVDYVPTKQTAESEVFYLRKRGEKFDMYYSDKDRNIFSLNIDVNPNLFRQSTSFAVLVNTGVNVSSQNFFLGLKNSMFALEGLVNNGTEWGFDTHSVGLRGERRIIKDVTNKPIVVSVDVMPSNYDVKVGMNVRGFFDMPFVAKRGEWTRIYKAYSGDRLVGISARLNDPSQVTSPEVNSNTLYFKNWKVEEGLIPTEWLPCWDDLSENQLTFVKTDKSTISNDELIENMFQKFKTVGLQQRNTIIDLNANDFNFKCKYLILSDNSTITFRGVATRSIISNVGNNSKVFTGNRGDSVDVHFFQDENEQILCTLRFETFRNK
ncbi:hypothetical protein ACI76O_05370 [Capnocytophaga cynodegmi]|uniref:hypothetical protein n=1 Tax=Capnocytophaga cynodegmi TaxID=28189 RepID=UPI00385B0098